MTEMVPRPEDHKARSSKKAESKPELDFTVKEWEELQKWENIDLVALASSSVQSFVQRRPIITGIWAFGLFLVAFAGGLPVNSEAEEAYMVMFQQAEVIESRTFGRSVEELRELEQNYSSAKGWFGACDDACMKLFDRVQMARAEVARVQRHRDDVLSHARQEVGIWSTFGVQDVRKSFWSAWKAGKDFAATCTMYDAFFLVGGRDETAATIMIKLILQYAVNLTLGLIGAFCAFVYNVYCLIASYGSSVLSGVAFLLLAVVAGASMVATYLGLVYGAIAGGGMVLMQQEAKRAAIESGKAPPKQLRGARRPPRCPV